MSQVYIVEYEVTPGNWMFWNWFTTAKRAEKFIQRRPNPDVYRVSKKREGV